MNAAITAGGRVDGKLRDLMGTPVKALARVDGRTLLERAISAARQAGAEKIAVVGGAEVRAACANSVEMIVDERPSGAQNVHGALFAWPQEPLLYLSSDLPYLSGEAVREFLERAQPDAIAMPLADAQAYAKRFPSAPAHAVTIGGERVANGSVFFIPQGAAYAIDAAAQRFFRARKSLVKMAMLLGPELLWKFLVRRLRIADIERKAARELGFGVFAIRDSAPELCFDIDTEADFAYALAHR
ncbi:MAG: NTP transferase domain-containing protein [Candidatus Eremiobacteraeota bacterium]|nr:NTP transferase domain-containing protein [Candidatus Eremiobacteraeota bacterium]